MNAGEDQRQRHEQVLLARVGGRRHEQRRADLRADVDHHQRHERRGRQLLQVLRDVGHEAAEEGQVVARLDEARRVAQHVVEADEDRDLDDDRQAGPERVDALVLVELHHLLVQHLAVAAVLLLELADLGLQRLHAAHRLLLLDRQRHEREAHEEGEQDDRPRPRRARDVVDVDEGPAQRVRDRPDRRRAREDEAHRGLTGSYPPRLQGLQRRRRQTARAEPRTNPCTATASSA